MKTISFETEEPVLASRKRVTPDEKASVREQKKHLKRDRIKAAAKELFSRQEYEKATVREIASQAGVALGTISLYARDKRDLILLAYNDDVTDMIARGAKACRSDEPFEDNLIGFFQVFYEAYVANLQLARTYLQVNFFSYGINSKALAQNRQRKLDVVAKIVRWGQRRREVRADIKADIIAMQLLLLHSSAVRTWVLEEHPSIVDGLIEMRKLIALQTQGLNPQSN
ncbi:TetR/AcrR family transcriptional regulator [Oricola indica]|uniref:TetR/AcrR family transcriptional regulator n=1 Tax=Oricola indica TaxID=2872591 RepID=UPI003CCBDB32